MSVQMNIKIFLKTKYHYEINLKNTIGYYIRFKQSEHSLNDFTLGIIII